VPKAFKDLQRFIQLLQDSFEGVHGVAERTPVRFLEFFKAFRQIYSIKLTLEEVVKKLDPRITMAAAQLLVKPEVLEKAKWIIEAVPKLIEINKIRPPPEMGILGMTHLVNQLVEHIKHVRDPEALIRALPGMLRKAFDSTQVYFPNDLLLEIIEFEEENNKFKDIIMTLKEDLKSIQLNEN
jgi:hypothetical protein